MSKNASAIVLASIFVNETASGYLVAQSTKSKMYLDPLTIAGAMGPIRIATLLKG